MAFNLLVLASDQQTGSNFAKSLQLSRQPHDDFTIIGTTTHPVRAQIAANDKTVLLPDNISGDPIQTLRYVENKLDVKIGLLYETRSGNPMLAVSRNRDTLPVFLPASETVEIFEDKFQTFTHLARQGFPVPQTRLVNNPDDVRRALNDMQAENFWVRAIMGQGGTGAFSSKDPQEIIGTISQQDGWGRYAISEKLPIDAETSWEARLSDDFHPGEMINWLALYDEGRLVAAQTRKRLYFEHGELTPSGVGYSGGVMSLQRDDIHEICDKMVRAFGHEPHGALGADFVVDNHGEPKLTEVQACRFYTTTYFLSMMGLNFPRLYLDCARGQFPDMEQRVNPVPAGMIWIQRFGADDTLRHRDEILDGMATGIVENDAASIIHRHISEPTRSAILRTSHPAGSVRSL